MSKAPARALVIAGALIAVFAARWVWTGAAPSVSKAAAPAATVTLTGTARDFRGYNESGGHMDFENTSVTNTGHCYQIVKDILGADGKPVFRSGGLPVNSMATDLKGNSILTGKAYLSGLAGDTAASMGSSTATLVNNAASFNQWYNDVSGVNQSMPITLTFNYDAASSSYVFDDKTDPTFKTLGGFFPINNQLFGNTPGRSSNYGFTFELQTTFTYTAGVGQSFTFSGDDDVWVFIDNKLVIDLGGIHGRITQTINLDRVSGLVNQGQYSLAVFFAERHVTSSNFRIQTTLALQPAVKKRVTSWIESEPN